MSEIDKNLFAELFGGQKKKEAVSTTETTPAMPDKKDEPIVIAVNSSKMIEKELEGTTTLSSREDEPKEKPTDEAASDADDGVDPKELAYAKKELGIGGAAFCDELFATCPDIFTRLKAAGKTLHGLFNFAYSYALDEYVKKHGKVNGGGYWNLAALAEKYLDPNVKEGYTVKEPKVKKPEVPTPPKTDAAKTVAKVAKRAAKAAKKAMAKKTETSSVPTETNERKKTPFDFSKFDFSKISM